MADTTVIDSAESEGVRFDVVQHEALDGTSDARAAERLFFAQQAGMRLKAVRLTLAKSAARTEPGALYYMSGDLEMKASTGGGVLRGLARKMTSGESFFVNEIHGSGTVHLEPTFGHFVLIEMAGEALIVDKSLFYAGSASLDISAQLQRNVSSGLFGGEGLFQTRIAGTGVAVLHSPVPWSEVEIVELEGGKLSVDGNFALARTDGVSFKAEKSSKSWVATSVSGEGLLQTFSGRGSVWLAPTQGVYEKLRTDEGLRALAGPSASMGTMTDGG